MYRYFKLYVLIMCATMRSYAEVDKDLVEIVRKDMENISKEFILGLRSALEEYANSEEIEKSLKNSTIEYSSESVKGENMLNNFVDGLESSFQDKTKVLENIQRKVQKAEEKGHKYKKDIERFEYLNMRTVNATDENTLTFYKSFTDSFKVNMTNSFVQVPTNIWAYKATVLNKVRWTKNIDNSFTENFKNSNQSLLYQYYGDKSGVFRIFPGNVIGVKPNDGETDLYDCRRRVWYIQASASPKDIVIVIDISGSMIGNNIGIAKITSSSLIDTLQENDFFNVIAVNNTVTYVHPCIDYVIQATRENKEMMKRLIQNIPTPDNIIDADVGMEEAFKILAKNPNENYTKPSSNCNKAIMFITDGVEGEYAAKKTLEKYNADKKVRIFSFLVGRMKNPDKKALVKMSCDNYGHFYAIETLGNVWDTVLGYLQVMSRPIARAYDDNDVKPSYTPAYLDSAGFGMIMSVSMSVFRQQITTDDKGNTHTIHDKLIGIVGTDISLKNLMDSVPQSQMSPFSHGFVINNNGFILIHPKFRKQEGYLPAPPNILLEDIEYSHDPNNSITLKKDMIDSISEEAVEVKKEEFPTYWLYDNNRKLIESKTRYFFKHINGTDFVAAIAVLNSSDYLSIKNEDAVLLKKGVEALNGTFLFAGTVNDTSEYTYVKISPWNYCKNVKPGDDKPKGIISYPNADELFQALQKDVGTSVKSCDIGLIKRLLLPAGAVHDATKKWKLGNDTVNTVFFATSGGFMKYMTASNETSAQYDRDVLRTDIFENAVANPTANIIASAPARKGKTSSNEPVYVTMMSSVKAEGMVNAVFGAKLSSDYLNEIFINSTLQDSAYKKCNNNDTALCAIIDENVFIVASNQYSKYTGRFLGERIGVLVNAMLEKGILKEYHLKDTQAECAQSDENTSSANFLLTPARIIINILFLMSKSVYWLTVQLAIFLMSLMAPDANHVSAQKPRTIQVSCTKNMTFYRVVDTFPGNDNKFIKGKFQCLPNRKCNKMPYAIYKIPETNMNFLIVEADPDCNCYDLKISIEPIKVPESDKWCSKEPPTFNYRKQSTSCINSTLAESSTEACGGASHINLSLSTLAIVLIFSGLVQCLF